MSAFTPPEDFKAFLTEDGSRTLRSEQLGEQYHSLHGAVQESMHVFIEAGLRSVEGRAVSVLEVGLGTGLNALLTLRETMATELHVAYTALEPFPLSWGHVQALGHPAAVGTTGLEAAFERMMTALPGTPVNITARFSFTRSSSSVLAFAERGAFDVIYFDAFGPPTQPELWTDDVFVRMFAALRPGGRLVTYCAKGEVRRAMQRAGFTVERLPGPKGKREMLRATKHAGQ
jgi:tRNA U34 5-methylaminomethyl-2-thiouridine-forming methyltransferase MnmC